MTRELQNVTILKGDEIRDDIGDDEDDTRMTSGHPKGLGTVEY